MNDDDNVAQFCAVTGASSEVARNYLDIADNNIETAVTLYMENGEEHITSPIATQPPLPATRSPTQASSDCNVQTEDIQRDEELARQLQEQEERLDVRAPIAPKHDILSGGGTSAIWESRGTMKPTIFYQGDSSTSDAHQTTDWGSDSPGESSAGAESSATSFKAKRLADLFRPPYDIITRGSFENARKTARERGKWLLVNIQIPNDFPCLVLNRDLWSDAFVKEIVRESFVFLQYRNESPEGQRYTTYYPVNAYPHVAIIDACTGERIKVWSEQLKPTEFMMEVTEFLDQHPNPKRAKITPSASEMSEEEQMKAAIAASLHNHASETPVAVGQSPDAEKEPIESPDSPFSPEDPLVSRLRAIQAIKKDEPTDLTKSTRIQIRTADGARIIRRFLNTDPVRVVFEFVKHEIPGAKDRPFELVFNYKQLIDLLDQEIQEAGLKNAAVNFQFV